MSNYDGSAERAAILVKLKTLVGGRVFENLPDDADLPLDSNGNIKPFLVVDVGIPFRWMRERTIAGEKQQPFRMGTRVMVVAPNSDILNTTRVAVINLLFDWKINNNTSPMVLDGSSIFPGLDTKIKPTRFEQVLMFSNFLNMNVDYTL